jgi:hypothetical protein
VILPQFDGEELLMYDPPEAIDDPSAVKIYSRWGLVGQGIKACSFRKGLLGKH